MDEDPSIAIVGRPSLDLRAALDHAGGVSCPWMADDESTQRRRRVEPLLADRLERATLRQLWQHLDPGTRHRNGHFKHHLAERLALRIDPP